MKTDEIHHPIEDLAPGDQGSAQWDWSGIQVRSITSEHDPGFPLVYEKFWAEFGEKNELEDPSTLIRRFQWKPRETHADYSLHYEMIGVFKEDAFVAARDHSVILYHPKSNPKQSFALVHLSHALIAPQHRGQGLIGWIRAWPIQRAKKFIQEAGLSPETQIILLAEMEPAREQDPFSLKRLRSYRRAGFLMVDPVTVSYCQPDFRSPAQIDRSGGPQFLPLRLILRWVGQESQREISGQTLKQWVSALYHMYAQGFRSQDMKPLWTQLEESYPKDSSRVLLVAPDFDPCGSSPTSPMKGSSS
ncbi:MAG: hypothetical protein ACO3A2_05530 [Bdellovibrionia bacterium]